MTLQPLPPRDGVRVVRAAGELDVVTTPELYADACRAAGHGEPVVLDLTAVTFLDSAGVRLVDVLARECASRAVTLRVAAPPGSPSRHVLELVGMVDGLVCDDVPSAVAQVRAG